MVDPWDPKSFSGEITHILTDNSELILNYFTEESKLMDEHLNSSPYESLKPNKFHSNYSDFKDNILTPILKASRIRVWHYTRLIDAEVDMMTNKLVLSSLDFLQLRLGILVSYGLVSCKESELVFKKSVFHKQEKNRSGMLWSTTIPLPSSDSGVAPLMDSWGGESAYFWLSNDDVKLKLKRIGLKRIIEIETGLSDKYNADNVSETILQAWAKKLGVVISPEGTDLAITSCIENARVIKVHTEGEVSFNAVANTYPNDVSKLLSKCIYI